MTTLSRRGVLGGGAGLAALSTAPLRSARGESANPPLAPIPPMGWNSWNSFATTITEAQTLEQAAIMARVLKPAGYDILTVDIQWYEPNASSYDYDANPKPTLDAHGRLLPAPNRFPSSVDGRGFKPLGDRVRKLGLRFGIHRMRGIPRLAVERNLPVLGTQYRARDIADTNSTSSWNPDMYGVDMAKPGAQDYYDSVFRQYADWGVDFVKVDDLSRPYDAHMPEIEGIHRAIANCGRPMILSMSPGETPVPRGDHARKFSQMSRISDDFWDDWSQLYSQFTRLENWNRYMGGGFWPDADMLPLGRIALGKRDSNFTPDEKRTLMTLWSIARSPLIMGGDLRYLDAATTDLLINPEVIAVNQTSSENRPHFLKDHAKIWTAKAVNGDTYLALFNPTDDPQSIEVKLAEIGAPGKVTIRDVWARKGDGMAAGIIGRQLPKHGAALLRLAAA